MGSVHPLGLGRHRGGDLLQDPLRRRRAHDLRQRRPVGDGPGGRHPPHPQAPPDRLAAALAGNGRWLTLLGFFGAGLLLAFTQCVLPMIPILSGLIAGQGTRLGTRRALLLSLVYVVANALVFTAAGVVAGLVGANLQIESTPGKGTTVLVRMAVPAGVGQMANHA